MTLELPTSDVPLDLPIAAISQTVEVVGLASVVSEGTTISRSDTIGGKELEQFTGGGFQAALRLLASIIEVPGGLSIKGGRPSQASVQIGPSTLVDPSTGLTAVALPELLIQLKANGYKVVQLKAKNAVATLPQYDAAMAKAQTGQTVDARPTGSIVRTISGYSN